MRKSGRIAIRVMSGEENGKERLLGKEERWKGHISEQEKVKEWKEGGYDGREDEERR